MSEKQGGQKGNAGCAIFAILTFFAFLWSLGLGELLGLKRPSPPETQSSISRASYDVRDTCLEALKPKVNSIRADLDPSNMPIVSGEVWKWQSFILEFDGNREVRKDFLCILKGDPISPTEIELKLL